MGRLIDGDALMPKLKFIQEAEHQIYGKESWGFASKCITAIEDAPTIEERKTGKWIYDGSGLDYACSVCKESLGSYVFFTEDGELVEIPNFCPNCGAEMRGEPR